MGIGSVDRHDESLDAWSAAVKMRVLDSQRRDIDSIAKLTVPSARGPVRIDSIAQLERGLGPTTLQRYNRQFSINLYSDLAPGRALDEAAAEVRRLAGSLELPPGYSFRLAGQPASRGMKRSSKRAARACGRS